MSDERQRRYDRAMSLGDRLDTISQAELEAELGALDWAWVGGTLSYDGGEWDTTPHAMSVELVIYYDAGMAEEEGEPFWEDSFLAFGSTSLAALREATGKAIEAAKHVYDLDREDVR